MPTHCTECHRPTLGAHTAHCLTQPASTALNTAHNIDLQLASVMTLLLSVFFCELACKQERQQPFSPSTLGQPIFFPSPLKPHMLPLWVLTTQTGLDDKLHNPPFYSTCFLVFQATLRTAVRSREHTLDISLM